MTQPTPPTIDEPQRVRERYTRRDTSPGGYYDPLNPWRYKAFHDRHGALARLVRTAGLEPVRDRTVLEVGCGTGTNLLDLLRLGFQPQNLVGVDLIEEFASEACRVLPSEVRIITGDAATVDLPPGPYDIVLQATVFTSLLDNDFQTQLADRMWSLVKPGGGVLWYDFVYNNPRNPDVRGVPLRRVQELFPAGHLSAWRVTLAPPLAYRATRVHPALYTLLNALPFLRTHMLCWIGKPIR